MRQVAFPTVAKIKAWTLAVMAHSRGYVGAGSHYSFERGPGARVVGSLEFTPLCTTDALRVRAFLHSQRGRSGTFSMPVINRALTVNSCGEEFTQFTDCTGFSDATTFDDLWLGVLAGTTDASAAAGASTLPVASTTGVAVGDWLLVAGQLVRVVAVTDGVSFDIRPRLRAAVAPGVTWQAGPVPAEFRILDDAPVIPLIPGRSREFSIEIEEAY